MDVVGGRFVIEREAGAGAMARVFRARDVTTNTHVALKILNSISEHTMRRFEREVEALSELTHPGIVRYIAHGATASGQAFLAMEWLAGESLEARLEREPLTAEEAVALGRAVASALGAAHARGLVHRDVKPANIFLVDGDPTQAKLLDFGLARDTMATFGLTNTGDLLGTPLFMAPEQASCELDIDARCDVYALGAVLYNCLAGRPPLTAPNLPGLLAKIILEQPPPLTGVAPSIAALVSRMLSKQRAERPADGAAADAALESAAIGLSQERGRTPGPVLPSREQRVVSILLATHVVPDQASLDATLGSYGGVLALADGSTMVVFSGPETPVDLAARAARYALGLRTPNGVVSLATGRAVLSGPMPMGEVIDRAALQLTAVAGTVRVDAETAGLLEGRFALATDSTGIALVGEPAGELDPVRTLLGKPTRCIGRDRELAAIEGYFAECIGESTARAVIVIADAGVGKSRLANELQRRLATHSEAPEVIVVRCESITESSPFAAAAAAIRRGHAVDAASDEFLAELVGQPAPAPSERMRAARENPALMFDHIRTAWVGWLRGLCAARPVLFVIEDLHWADESSVQLIDAALGALADAPLMVLALARPEVRARKPWSSRRPHELRLDPLAKRASERLVRDALGGLATDDIVAGILSRADGNALFLEELVRAAANPNVTSLPVGVIGTLQLRFDSLRAESRTVLRVASVFGERFTRSGIVDLLPAAIDVDAALRELTAAELIGNAADQFAFRHALVREAAYSMLPDEDRKLAHALAAEVLARDSDHDAAVIARHYELGHRHSDAARWYAEAAEFALARNDLSGAIAHAQLAQSWTDDAARGGMLDLLVADAELWRGNLPQAQTAALRATVRLPAESAAWLHAAGLIITTAGQQGDNEQVKSWLERVLPIEPAPDAVAALVVALSRGASQLAWSDETDLVRRAFARANTLAHGHELAPIAAARLEFARAYDHFADARLDAFARTMDGVVASYERFGAQREALQMRLIRLTLGHLAGLFPDVQAQLTAVVDDATRIGATYLAHWARYERGMMYLMALDRERAATILAEVPDSFKQAPLFVAGHAVLSCRAAQHANDADELERSLALVTSVPLSTRHRRAFQAFHAYLHLLRGRRDDAEREARAAVRSMATAPGLKADVSRCAYAVAFTVLVRVGASDARALIDEHLAELEGYGAAFTDPEARADFVDRLPWHREIRELRQQIG